MGTWVEVGDFKSRWSVDGLIDISGEVSLALAWQV